MAAQRLGRVEAAGKLCFADGGVDFLVADVVHQDDRTLGAALGARDQVMQALRDIRRDRTVAKGAERMIVHPADMGIVPRLAQATMDAPRLILDPV